MKISIVMPTYNVSKYIDRSITSCLKQLYKDIELIIVDDCGIDDSIEKAYQYAQNNARIKVVHNPKNLGTFHARRVGVKAASGKYILFLDPDDEIELNTIEKLSTMLDKQPDLVFYGSRTVPAPKPWQGTPKTPTLNSSLNYDDTIEQVLKCKRLSTGTEGKLIKKSTLLKAYDLLSIDTNKRMICGEDTLLFSALLMVLQTAASTSGKFYIYHKNESSITAVSDSQGLIKNISYLDEVIDINRKLLSSDKTKQNIQKYIDNKLIVYRVKLSNKVESVKAKKLINYIKIVRITKSPREIVKLLIFLFSFGKKTI